MTEKILRQQYKQVLLLPKEEIPERAYVLTIMWCVEVR